MSVASSVARELEVRFGVGWLRDLMHGAQPPYRSFGALARAAVSHADWPAEVKTQPRSLATVLSKLDRDEEIEWLADRPPVQHVLAQLLGCPVADVQAHVVAGSQRPDAATRRVRLEDLRFARALDLLEDSLPPSIPDAVLHPESWGRLWWIAPSGAGRTLVERWLEARGLTAMNLAKRATRAPVFVELHEPSTVPERDRLCVAAPFGPPDASWTVVESEPIESVIGELTEWVAERLDPSGQFEPARAAAWLREGPIARGDVDALGTALGLCGLIDELGFRSVEGRSLADAARRYLEQRLAEWRRSQGGDTAGFERKAFDGLVGIVMRTLTDDDRAWNAPRSFDEWIALVPPEHQHGADADWLRVSLPRVGALVRGFEVERAARRLPPGAYRVVRALTGARILCPTTDDRFEIAPRWLGVVARREAERRLARSSPFEWGEALLRPHAASGVADAVLERALTDASTLEAVLELEDDDNPAHVATVELAFRAAGVAMLSGVELPVELGEALMAEVSALWLRLPGEPVQPRIDYSEPVGSPLLSRGCCLLSLLALGELGAEAPSAEVLAAIDAVLPRLPQGVAISALALLDRLPRDVDHRLYAVSQLLDTIDAPALGVVRDVPSAAALARVAAQRGVPFERAASAAWSAWKRAGSPELPPLLLERALWRELPPSLVDAALARAGKDAPLSALTDAQWAALRAPDERVLAAMPEAHAARLLAEGVPAGAHVLWQRFPDATLAALRSHLASNRAEAALELAACAPAELTERVVDALSRQDLDRFSDQALTSLRRFLHARVGARSPGWRAAYALLADTERMLARSRPAV